MRTNLEADPKDLTSKKNRRKNQIRAHCALNGLTPLLMGAQTRPVQNQTQSLTPEQGKSLIGGNLEQDQAAMGDLMLRGDDKDPRGSSWDTFSSNTMSSHINN